MTKISVIIPTYNRADSVVKTLKCLKRQKVEFGCEYEVLVVDNNSNDLTVKAVRSFISIFSKKFRYYFESRQGRAHALNLGIKHAKGDIIVCLDDDCIVDDGYIMSIYNAFKEAGEEVGFIGGKILPHWLGGEPSSWLKEFLPGSPERSKNWDGTNEFFCGPLGILDYGDQPFVIEPNLKGEYPKLFYGANISFRRSVFDRLGSFSSESTLVEDTEMCLRILNSGVKALYSPKIKVFHKINTAKIGPEYYFHWYFMKGMRREIIRKTDDAFCNESWAMFHKPHLKSMKEMMMNRCQALFNIGQMLKGGVIEGQKKPMKILYVLAFNPIRIMYGVEFRNRRFIEFLRTKGDLDLLTLERSSESADMEYIHQNFCRHYALDALGKPISKWKRLLHQLPWQLGQLYNDEAQKTIVKILEENNYDLIFVSKLYPVKYFSDLPAKWREKVIMDFDDILSDLYRDYYKDLIKSQKNSFMLRFHEHRAMERFRRVFICSDDALQKIKCRYRKKVGIIPNVYEIKIDSFLKAGEDPNRLLFVGSLDYFPNLEGLSWFLKTIWPQVKIKFPNFKLTIIGKTWKSLESVHCQLGHRNDVEIVVNVKSVVPYYQKCFASIVPLLDGSGTRVKILESASFGRPVFTTIKGMEGLEFKDKKEIFLFKDAATFIEAYQLLLANGVYDQVARDAFQVLQKKYSPRNFEIQMKNNWDEIVNLNGN